MFSKFKELWYQQYLLSLRETAREVYQGEWENRIRVNDIVLVNTKDKPRIHWLMARVVQLFYDDG